MFTLVLVFVAGFILGQITKIIPILDAWVCESREKKLYWEEVKEDRIRNKRISDLRYHIQMEFVPKKLQDWGDVVCAIKINSLLIAMVDLNLHQSSQPALRKYNEKVSEIIDYLVSFDETEQYSICEEFRVNMDAFRDLCIKEHITLSVM